MREKILALLVTKFQGARKDVLNQLARALALQATTDDEAKALVDKLTDAQVTEFVKETRADVDKEVSESNKTFESNLRKKYDFKEKGKGTDTDTEPGGGRGNDKPDDIARIVAEAVAKAVQPLNDKIARYDAESLAKTRLQALNDKLNGCKDENFKNQTLKDFARMKFDTDDSFNEYLNDKAKDIENANQNVADTALRNGGGSPLFSQKDNDGISKGVADYVESQKPANNPFAGKAV